VAEADTQQWHAAFQQVPTQLHRVGQARRITRAVGQDNAVRFVAHDVSQPGILAHDDHVDAAAAERAQLIPLHPVVDDDDARFTLEVRRSNAIAIHLYEREGFRAAGMRRRYYQDNGEDALVMWRTPATRAGSLDDVPNPGVA